MESEYRGRRRSGTCGKCRGAPWEMGERALSDCRGDDKNGQKCKELPHWVTPPQPKAGGPCATSGNSGPALDKLLKPGQVLAGALTVPSNYGVGTRSPTWTLVE